MLSSQILNSSLFFLDCNNTHDSWDCYIWAKQGECERNPPFMNKFCKKACGLCGEKEDLKMSKSGIYVILYLN